MSAYLPLQENEQQHNLTTNNRTTITSVVTN